MRLSASSNQVTASVYASPKRLVARWQRIDRLSGRRRPAADRCACFRCEYHRLQVILSGSLRLHGSAVWGFQGGYSPWQDRVFRLRSHGSVHALCRNPILQSAHCSLFSAHCSPLACVKWCLAVKEEKGTYLFYRDLNKVPCGKIGRCTLIKRVELRTYIGKRIA